MLVCGKSVTSKLEVGVGYNLSEGREQISASDAFGAFLRRKALRIFIATDPRLAAVEQAAIVSSSSMFTYPDARIEYLKPVIRYEIKDFLQMDYATKASLFG